MQINDSPVRNKSVQVVESAKNVKIDESKINDLVDNIIENYEFSIPSWDAPVFPSITNTEKSTIIDYFFVGNSLNYCFNELGTGVKYKTRYLDTEWSGSFGMWAALKRSLDNNIPILNPDYLQNVTVEDVEEIFKPCDETKIPMIETRAENLRHLGNLMNYVGGSFENLIDESVYLYGPDGIVSMLSDSKSFEDKRVYNGEIIQFNKRSQLTVAMLYGKFKDTKYEFEIEDMNSFTVFADYGIPAGLASWGVLQYTDELEESIKNNKLISENSPEEVEIRAATVVAGDYIHQKINEKTKQDINFVILDYLLWKMRTDANTNTHITQTKAY